jgi:hypothetical protein
MKLNLQRIKCERSFFTCFICYLGKIYWGCDGKNEYCRFSRYLLVTFTRNFQPKDCKGKSCGQMWAIFRQNTKFSAQVHPVYTVIFFRRNLFEMGESAQLNFAPKIFGRNLAEIPPNRKKIGHKF